MNSFMIKTVLGDLQRSPTTKFTQIQDTIFPPVSMVGKSLILDSSTCPIVAGDSAPALALGWNQLWPWAGIACLVGERDCSHREHRGDHVAGT